MRKNWQKLAMAFGACCALTVAPSNARANGHSGLGGGQPPSYVMPTSYVVPTVYFDSGSYVATSWVELDAYETPYVVPTSYYLPRTAYAVTSYVVPTTGYYATTVLVPMASAPTAACCQPDPCCQSSVSAPLVMRPSREAMTTGNVAPASGESAAKPVPSTVESTPANVPDEKMPEPTKLRDSLTPSAANPPPVDSSVVSPPTAPVPEKDSITPITPEPAEKPGATGNPPAGGKTVPPVAPGGDGLVLPPKGDSGTVYRETKKPVNTPKTAIALASKVGAVNVLEGKVLREGRREPGVKITLTDPSGVRPSLETETDAFGHYAIDIPNGDWLVIVPQRSGKLFTVSTLTVGNGQIIDQQGRDVPSLVITR
jgi:hypothetical protein